jgi:hypothetical protein
MAVAGQQAGGDPVRLPGEMDQDAADPASWQTPTRRRSPPATQPTATSHRRYPYIAADFLPGVTAALPWIPTS